MKKLFATLILMLSISVNAKEPSQHMKFMGIPMDCDVETFAKKLSKEKGLKRGDFGNTDRPTLLGSFSGYKDCIFILEGEGDNPIGMVGVIFPMQESFILLRSQYQTMKSNLTTKYGSPTNEEEGFFDYEPSTDYGRMRELREGNAKFETSFVTDEGLIKMQMCSVDISGGYLQILYVDMNNAAKQNEKSLDDL